MADSIVLTIERVLVAAMRSAFFGGPSQLWLCDAQELANEVVCLQKKSVELLDTIADLKKEKAETEAENTRVNERLESVLTRAANPPLVLHTYEPASREKLDAELHDSVLAKWVFALLEAGETERADPEAPSRSYSGQSLAHCLKSYGWVREDLRLGLMKANPVYRTDQELLKGKLQ